MTRHSRSKVSSKKTSVAYPWRFRVLLLGFTLCLGAIGGYTFQLNWGQGDFLRQQGSMRATGGLTIPAYRGTVVDRNGVPLAVSTEVVSIGVNPQVLSQRPEHWLTFATAFEVSLDDVADWLNKYSGRQFVYWRRHLDPQVANAILALKIPGVSGRTEYKRYYPAGEVTSHLLGFTNIDDQGQEGIELSYNAVLAGEQGRASSSRDRRGRVVDMWEVDEAAREGQDLALTIDLRMQYLAHRALAKAVDQHNAKGGSLVALDVATGEVLAMTNQPAFNPNNRIDLDYDSVRNRAVTDVFEPGSTVKPFTVAAALTSGTHEAYTPIQTAPGTMQVGRKTIRDISNYGLIDVQTVLTKSSNVGVAKIALSMAPNYLTGFYDRLGLGHATDLLLSGERTGYMPMKNRWSDLEVATLSFGYGMSVTALQLAQAYSVVADNGVKRSLSVVSQTGIPAQRQQVMDPEVASTVSDILETVTGREGTAKRAQVPGYRVAGKTGTVHKVVKTGYAEDQYLSLFAGFAPATDPKIVIVVVVDEPNAGQHYGGQVAAPVFSEAMGGMLRLAGVQMDDMSIKDQYYAQAKL